MMCSQRCSIDSLWFSTGEPQDMVANMAGAGALDLFRLEQTIFPLAEVNEALNDLPAARRVSNYLRIRWARVRGGAPSSHGRRLYAMLLMLGIDLLSLGSCSSRCPVDQVSGSF